MAPPPPKDLIDLLERAFQRGELSWDDLNKARVAWDPPLRNARLVQAAVFIVGLWIGLETNVLTNRVDSGASSPGWAASLTTSLLVVLPLLALLAFLVSGSEPRRHALRTLPSVVPARAAVVRRYEVALLGTLQKLAGRGQTWTVTVVGTPESNTKWETAKESYQSSCNLLPLDHPDVDRYWPTAGDLIETTGKRLAGLPQLRAMEPSLEFENQLKALWR